MTPWHPHSRICMASLGSIEQPIQHCTSRHRVTPKKRHFMILKSKRATSFLMGVFTALHRSYNSPFLWIVILRLFLPIQQNNDICKKKLFSIISNKQIIEFTLNNIMLNGMKASTLSFMYCSKVIKDILTIIMFCINIKRIYIAYFYDLVFLLLRTM